MDTNSSKVANQNSIQQKTLKDKIQENPLLNTVEAAEVVGVKPSTLHKLRCTGGGPRFSKAAGIRYRYSDLMEWLDSKTFSNTGEAQAAK